MTDFIAGFNITVEKEREDLEDMVNDLLEVEKKCNKLLNIWERFEELYGQFMIPVEGNRGLIQKLMVDLEIDNDYFPKEKKVNV